MDQGLAKRDLAACPPETAPLAGEELARLVAALPGWRVESGRLERAFRCADFAGAMGLANQVLPIAEDAGHHPDLVVRWGELRVTIWTHLIGGLHVNDFIVAARIEEALDA